MKFPRIRHPRFWITVACVVTLAAVVAGVTYTISLPSSEVTKDQRLPVQTQPLIPTDLDQALAWFGPWTTLGSGETGAPALVLLHAGGSVDRSSWTAAIDDTWKRLDPPQITNMTESSDEVAFTTDDGKTYTVGYNQPFIIERLPQQVFAFTINNSKINIVSTTVERVHQLAYKLKREGALK